MHEVLEVRVDPLRKWAPRAIRTVFGTWLVPHHPVWNPNKPSKCRPVFDASAVHRGASLNAALLKGPDMLTNLIGVLLRFRENPVTLSADIVKMFHQVRVRSADWPALRFYWREPGSAEQPSVYQMDVQIFGSVCSPAICAYVLRRAAEDGGADAPTVIRQIEDHIYVDNWLTSFQTEEEVTNSFVVKATIRPDSSTKRDILRNTASIYDPCGFPSPVLLRAKLILQAVCRLAASWDDALDPIILGNWRDWATELSQLVPLRIPRCFNPRRTGSQGIGLHIFAETSESAFGAISYLLRFRRKSQQLLSLLAAASRPSTTPNDGCPTDRLQTFQRAFTNTGVDYFSPIEVTIIRRKVKRWGCIFTCLASRAVHIEMDYSLDTDSFLSCLSRFEDRRGTPSAYFSDNGTNFVGADNELKKCLKRLNQSKIHDQLGRRDVQWNFIPPASPHFGGSWKSLVKSAKRALKFVLHGQTLTDENLTTSLVKVENLLNGRPLTHVSIDPNDPEAITPNHLLLECANSSVPIDIIETADLSSKKRWCIVQAITEHFWRRWMGEYLPVLTKRSKWLSKATRTLPSATLF